MERRVFLKRMGAAVLALTPLEALAAENKKKVMVDAYVGRISEDKLSNDFYANKQRGLWLPIAEKVKQFYGNHLDLEIRFRENEQVDKTNLQRNHLALEYTTLDNMLKNPKVVLHAFGGQELIDELESEVKKAQKEEGWNHATAESTVLNNVIKGIYSHFSGEGGFGSPIAHRAWIFPSQTYYRSARDENELANTYAFSACHEIGHALGLPHVESLTRYGPDNVMNPHIALQDVVDFKFTLHPEQADQIRSYLGA